jgi:predicted  nucleic acid-binding Zn-ribbon protein
LPHQCLNCGLVIPRGSQDILTGCSRCQGKKFMYVNRPMAEEKRLELKGKAEAVRDEILAKADKRLLSVLEKKGVAGLEGTKFTFQGSGDGWVRVKQEEAPHIPPEPEPKQEKAPSTKPSARSLIKDYDKAMVDAGKMRPIPDASPRTGEEPPEGITFTRPIAPEPAKPKKAMKKAKKALVTEGKADLKPKRPKKRKKARKKDDLGVITIVESGVYEIDVGKLLDDSPIIIEKDGTYLIHLPSLLEAKAKK